MKKREKMMIFILWTSCAPSQEVRNPQKGLGALKNESSVKGEETSSILSSKEETSSSFAESHSSFVVCPETSICQDFSEELRALCVEKDGGQACSKNEWNRSFYDSLVSILNHDNIIENVDEVKSSSLSVRNGKEVILLAKEFVGFSYWWGGAAFSRGATEKGSCRFVNGKNDFKGHSGPWGGDCSGYVSKMWNIPEVMPLEKQSHGPSTSGYLNDNYSWMKKISRDDTQEGDSFVYNANGAGHIVLFHKKDSWGKMYVYEAKGCKYGIVYNVKDLSSAYKARRRVWP